jgi:hypothetical protein
MLRPIKLKLGLTLFFCLAAACQAAPPACPPGSITYLPKSDANQASSVQENPQPADQLVEINGQEMLVNHVVRGRLCSGSWSGTVYVPCQVEIYAWEENPNFLENCDLSIAPGTVVYVAAHQDQPYYQGCSCHSETLDQ